MIGLADACFIGGIRRYAFINCAESPSDDEFACVAPEPAINGIFCCYERGY
jgi:hypothetical protein